MLLLNCTVKSFRLLTSFPLKPPFPLDGEFSPLGPETRSLQTCHVQVGVCPSHQEAHAFTEKVRVRQTQHLLRECPGGTAPSAPVLCTQPHSRRSRCSSAHPPCLCTIRMRLHEHQATCRSLFSSCPRAPTAWPVPVARLSSPCQPTASSRLLTPQVSWPGAPCIPAGGIHMLGTCRLLVVSVLKSQT